MIERQCVPSHLYAILIYFKAISYSTPPSLTSQQCLTSAPARQVAGGQEGVKKGAGAATKQAVAGGGRRSIWAGQGQERRSKSPAWQTGRSLTMIVMIV